MTHYRMSLENPGRNFPSSCGSALLSNKTFSLSLFEPIDFVVVEIFARGRNESLRSQKESHLSFNSIREKIAKVRPNSFRRRTATMEQLNWGETTKTKTKKTTQEKPRFEKVNVSYWFCGILTGFLNDRTQVYNK